MSWAAPRGITFTLVAMSHRQCSYQLGIIESRSLMFEKCSSQRQRRQQRGSETRADVNPESHLAIERWSSEKRPSRRKRKFRRSQRSINGAYVRLRYRPIVSQNKRQIELPVGVSRSPLSILGSEVYSLFSRDTACAAISLRLRAHTHLLCLCVTLVMPSLLLRAFSSLSFFHYLYFLSASLSLSLFLVAAFFLFGAWVENFQLAKRRHVQRRSNFGWLASRIGYTFEPRDLFKSETFNIRALLQFSGGLEWNCY